MKGAIANPIIAVLLMAAVTYLTRAIPLTFFRKEIRSPYIKTFFNYMPFAVLGALTFPDVLLPPGR